MLVDVDRESQAEFRSGSGTVGTDVVRLGSASARQTVALTAVSAGTFKLAFQEAATAAIASNAAAADVQTALEAVIGSGNVIVSGEAGGPWTVNFAGSLRWQFVAALTAIDVDLEGEGHAVAVTVNERGHAVGWPVRKYVMLRANGANNNVIMVGDRADNANDGFILSAGQQSPAICVDQLNKVYLVGGAAGQGYSWIACGEVSQWRSTPTSTARNRRRTSILLPASTSLPGQALLRQTAGRR